LSSAKIISVVIAGLLLVGCPAEFRIYVHNKSDLTLASAYQNANRDVVRIGPRKTKYLQGYFDREWCLKLNVDEVTKAYHIPREMFDETRSTGYGSRLDIYFEYGLLHVQYGDGRWVQLEEVDDCDYF